MYVVVDYQRHILSNCTEGLPQPASTPSVEGILLKSSEAPLTLLEQQLTTSLVRRQLSNSSTESGLLHVKTRGQVYICTYKIPAVLIYLIIQPLTFMKITKPRVDSETACKRSTKLRTQQLGKHRHLVRYDPATRRSQGLYSS